MKYLYYCHGKIDNSYISAVNNTLVKKLKEKYKGEVDFKFTPRDGITSYMIRARLNVESREKLLEIQEDIRYDEIRVRVIYKKWSKVINNN